MRISSYYNQFWEEALEKYERNAFELDPHIDNSKDKRFGLTIIIRPSPEVKTEIVSMLEELKQIEPHQYYYPESDLHVTALTVVSCYTGFTKKSFSPKKYIDVIRKSLHNVPPFNIHFNGITASPCCVMVQGFPGPTLNLFRKNLRDNFKDTNLETSFDMRYILKVAHASVMRFKNPVLNYDHFIGKLKSYRYHEFGNTNINEIEFVFNDWYLRNDKDFTIASLQLKLPKV